jgi:hypothetical protein
MGSPLLDGVDDFLYHNASPGVPTTVAAWFRPANATTRFGRIWWLGTTADVQHRRWMDYDMGGANKTLRAVKQGTGNFGDPAAATTTNSGGTAVAWHSGLIRYKPSDVMEAMLNGANEGTNTTAVTVNTPNRMEVGRSGGSSPGPYWPGHIGYIFGWSTEITDSEYTNDFQNGTLPQMENLMFAYDLTVDAVGGVYEDLSGNGFDLTVSGATFDSGQTPPVTYDLSGGATAAGQYGWGTYGAGTYGPNFGESSTPKTGSESFVLSESALVEVAHGRSESISVVEALVLEGQYAVVDSSALSSEAAALAVQTDVAASESHAQGEAATVAPAVAAAESFVLSESSSTASSLAALDSLTLGEVAAVNAALSAVDTATLGELVNSVGEQADKSATDSLLLSEAVALANALAASDAGSLGEVASLAAALAASEGVSLGEAASLLATTAASEQHTFAEGAGSVSTVDAKSASDTFSFTEGTPTVQSVDLKTAIDTFGVSEVAALAASVAASDASTLADMGSLNVVLVSSDDWALSEGAALLSSALSASEAFTFTDAPAVVETVLLKSAVDAFGLSEFAIVFTPSPSPDLRRPLTALVIAKDRSVALLVTSSSVEVVGRSRGAEVIQTSTDAAVS